MFSPWACLICSTVIWKLFPWTAGVFDLTPVFCTHDRFVILYFLFCDYRLESIQRNFLRQGNPSLNTLTETPRGRNRSRVYHQRKMLLFYWYAFYEPVVFQEIVALNLCICIKNITYRFAVSYDVTSCLDYESVLPGNDAECFIYECYEDGIRSVKVMG